jgi:hypothetical protein
MWIGLVALGASARLLPHPWNFTPMVAIGLFAGAHARRVGVAALATLLSFALSDAVLGYYRGVEWIYCAALIPVLFGRAIRNRSGLMNLAASALGSSLSFFIATNFAVWAAGQLYPRTFAGLTACYVAAIPFYANQFAGDVFYTALLFGGYAVLVRLMTRTPRQAAA